MRKSRSARPSEHPITAEDIRTIQYDLERVSVFHEKPIEVELPELGLSFTAGEGFGGFSASIFARGENCTACGLCCMNARRRVWLWHEDDPQPSDLPQVLFLLNGVEVPMRYHMQKDGQRLVNCDYLEPYTILGEHQVEQNGLPMHICTLHGQEAPLNQVSAGSIGIGERNYDIKPLHCRVDPFLSIHTVRTKLGNRRLFSRRLPSRNWRWPKCPIDVYNITISPEVAQADMRNFQQLYDRYGNLPGSRMGQGLLLWNETMIHALQGKMPEWSYILFEEEFNA